MRWCVTLAADHELLGALLTLTVGAALAVRASPVELGKGDVALVRLQTLVVILSRAPRAHNNLNRAGEMNVDHLGMALEVRDEVALLAIARAHVIRRDRWSHLLTSKHLGLILLITLLVRCRSRSDLREHQRVLLLVLALLPIEHL